MELFEVICFLLNRGRFLIVGENKGNIEGSRVGRKGEREREGE